MENEKTDENSMTPLEKFEESKKKYGYSHFTYDENGKFNGIAFQPGEIKKYVSFHFGNQDAPNQGISLEKEVFQQLTSIVSRLYTEQGIKLKITYTEEAVQD